MADITCSQCAEPNDIYGLRNDSIGYFDDDQGSALEPLGSIEDVLDHLATQGGDSRDAELGQIIAGIPDVPQPLSLPGLFAWWWSGADDPDTVEMKAVARLVNTAVYLGVVKGLGCPTCGFTHPERGDFRDDTVKELVYGGVIDLDPTPWID